jgi:hypothetical protein
VAPYLIAFAVFDFALSGYGVLSHVVNLISFSIAAWAVIVGYSRRPPEPLVVQPRSVEMASRIYVASGTARRTLEEADRRQPGCALSSLRRFDIHAFDPVVVAEPVHVAVPEVRYS